MDTDYMGFINFMRERGVEPTHKDCEHFKFLVKGLMEDTIESLEEKLDNAYMSMEAVLASGDLSSDTEGFLKLGFSNKPQHISTRLG